jgi:hypothetical protein
MFTSNDMKFFLGEYRTTLEKKRSSAVEVRKNFFIAVAGLVAATAVSSSVSHGHDLPDFLSLFFGVISVLAALLFVISVCEAAEAAGKLSDFEAKSAAGTFGSDDDLKSMLSTCKPMREIADAAVAAAMREAFGQWPPRGEVRAAD